MLILFAAALSWPALSVTEWLGLAGFILLWIVGAIVAYYTIHSGISRSTREYQDSSISALHEEMESRARRMSLIEQDIVSLRDDLCQRDGKIAHLTARVIELEAQVAQLRTQLSEKDAEITRLCGENAQLRNEIHDLEARLAEAEDKLAQARADLMNAHNIPS